MLCTVIRNVAGVRIVVPVAVSHADPVHQIQHLAVQWLLGYGRALPRVHGVRFLTAVDHLRDFAAAGSHRLSFRAARRCRAGSERSLATSAARHGTRGRRELVVHEVSVASALRHAPAHVKQ